MHTVSLVAVAAAMIIIGPASTTQSQQSTTCTPPSFKQEPTKSPPIEEEPTTPIKQGPKTPLPIKENQATPNLIKRETTTPPPFKQEPTESPPIEEEPTTPIQQGPKTPLPIKEDQAKPNPTERETTTPPLTNQEPSTPPPLKQDQIMPPLMNLVSTASHRMKQEPTKSTLIQKEATSPSPIKQPPTTPSPIKSQIKQEPTTPSPQHRGNILALSMQGYSRWISMINIANELKELGYKTTFVFPDDPQVTMIKEKFDVEIIHSDGMNKFVEYMMGGGFFASVVEHGLKGFTSPLSLYLKFEKYCTFVVGDTALMQALEKRHFDLVLIDTLFVNPCISVIPYKLSVPFIHYGAVFDVHHMRSLVHPSVYPVTKLLNLTDQMTYLERIGNHLVYLAMLTLPDLFSPSDIVGTFAPEKSHITNEELKAKTKVYLLESDELLDYHLPTYPNMVFVGGAATHPASPLTGNLKDFLDSAVDGAILVTFGSMIDVNALPDHILNNIRTAFKTQQKLKFVFKYGLNETRVDGNVLTMPWLPQNDILAHKNTKLFISHCGNNAQFESLYHAVPIICLPIFGDQHYNARRIHRKGYGLYFNIAKFTGEMLVSAINEILHNPAYQQTITKASKIFKSRPLTPVKRAAWWIDHVMKYGGDHLHPAVADLPYYQFLLLDIIASALIVCVMLSLMCYGCYRGIRRYGFRGIKHKID